MCDFSATERGEKKKRKQRQGKLEIKLLGGQEEIRVERRVNGEISRIRDKTTEKQTIVGHSQR